MNAISKISSSLDVAQLHIIQEFHISVCDFSIVFQPIYDIRNQSIRYMEALLRTKDQRFSNPLEVVEYFVNKGKSDVLTVMLFQLCETYIKSFARNGILTTINFEPQQIASKRFVPLLKKIFQNMRMCPGSVLLEVTERDCPEKYRSQFISNLLKLKKLGFRVAIDDFGVANSNFDLLSEVPFDLIKLDMFFLRNAMTSPIHFSLLEVCSSLQKKIGIPVCIEGIENDELLDLVKRLNVDYAQGYGLGRPKPFDELHY